MNLAGKSSRLIYMIAQGLNRPASRAAAILAATDKGPSRRHREPDLSRPLLA
jgi:hypothetical protein